MTFGDLKIAGRDKCSLTRRTLINPLHSFRRDAFLVIVDVVAHVRVVVYILIIVHVLVVVCIFNLVDFDQNLVVRSDCYNLVNLDQNLIVRSDSYNLVDFDQNRH